MELFLPKDSREFVMSLDPKEAFFCVESIGRYLPTLRAQKNVLGFQKMQARREDRQATDLYARLYPLQILEQSRTLVTQPGDRDILLRSLPLTLQIIDGTLRGDPDPFLNDSYINNPDKLLTARHTISGMIRALEIDTIKEKTQAYERIGATLTS